MAERQRQREGEALVEHLAPLLDARTGVLAGLGRLAFPAHFPGQMFGYSAAVPRAVALHSAPVAAGTEVGHLVGYGTSLEEPTAKIRAICEGVERYCAVMYPTHGLRIASERDLRPDVLELRRLPRCSERERERAPAAHQLPLPDPDREECWIRGYSVTHQKPIWVPISAVYLGLPFPPALHVVFPMSTGFAVGASYDAAVLSALLEVIERDSLALWWLHSLPMPRLVFDQAKEPRLFELLARNRAVGIENHLIDLTTDVGVPVVGIVQTSEAASPHFVAMGACRTTSGAAALRVLEEAGSLRIALSQQHAPVRRAQFFEAGGLEPEQFGYLYAPKSAREHFAFALEAPETTRVPNAVQDPPLASIVARLSQLGMEVIAVDVTLPEIEALGLCAVKVIVPELMTMTFSHHVRYLGHPRLYAAPLALGYGARNEESITDEPIPFA